MLLNEDQLAIRDLARRFARERLAPHYQAREAAGVLERDLIREMGSLGLMGADLPERFGGVRAPRLTPGGIPQGRAHGDFHLSPLPVRGTLLRARNLSHAPPRPG